MVRFPIFTSKKNKRFWQNLKGSSPKVSSILNKTLYKIIVLNHDMTCWKYEYIHNTCYVLFIIFIHDLFLSKHGDFFKINQVQIFYVRYVYTQ